MTQGFYERLGVHPEAELADVRSAYHRAVSRLNKRLSDIREQGGDPDQLDLSRAQVDEAWGVLSVPSRRQRYDAMLKFLEESHGGVDREDLWEAVGPALVPPSVAAAAELLRKATSLAVPPVGVPHLSNTASPPALHMPTAGPTPTLVAPTSATSAGEPVSADAATVIPVERGAPIQLPRPRPVAKVQDPDTLKVVQGRPTSSPVIVLSADSPRAKTLDPSQVAQLTDQHGYSGGLLHAVREAKGISLQAMADNTRISVRYLQALEADAFERLPSATFVKGYVREISRVLKLDEDSVVSGYMRRLSG